MNADAWDERYRGRDLVWGAEPNRFVTEAVAGLSPGRALDLACGEGRNAIWLAQRGWEVTGVDWSQVALDRAASLADASGVAVTWHCRDLRVWSPPERAFDLVLIVYLQVPEPDRRRTWAAAAAAVAPGGLLAVIGHDRRNLTEGIGGPQSPEVLYGADEVAAAVSPDLTVLEAGIVLRPVEVDGTVVHAVDNRVVAAREET